MVEFTRPDYLILGHITRDNTPQGPILGGTSSYSSLTAHRLQQKVALVTSVGEDIPSLAPLKDILIKYSVQPDSTTFENIYRNGVRYQKWLSSSAPLALDDVPPAWRQSPIVHLAPIGQEISPALCGEFPHSLVGVTGQGWLRGRDARMNVIYQPNLELEAWLGSIDVLVLSLSDLFGDEEALRHLLTSVKLGVETLGPDGCRLYHRGEVYHVPVDPKQEVDPTGAGDIFAAAFFIKYHQTGNFILAAQFANACASLSVLQVGLAGVPTLAEVEAHMAELYQAG